MQKNIVKITVSSLFMAALVAAPLLSRAEEAGAKAPAASDQTRPAKAKKKGTAFLGSLVAVDATAMTLTVSNLTMHVTSDTIIKTGSKSAKLSDAVVGQPTGGTYEKSADGKLTALTLHLSTKAGGKGAAKKSGGKKNKDSSDSTTTN
jgi:hypothetical protein